MFATRWWIFSIFYRSLRHDFHFPARSEVVMSNVKSMLNWNRLLGAILQTLIHIHNWKRSISVQTIRPEDDIYAESKEGQYSDRSVPQIHVDSKSITARYRLSFCCSHLILILTSRPILLTTTSHAGRWGYEFKSHEREQNSVRFFIYSKSH